jgi:hypothetical protein
MGVIEGEVVMVGLLRSGAGSITGEDAVGDGPAAGSPPVQAVTSKQTPTSGIAAARPHHSLTTSLPPLTT